LTGKNQPKQLIQSAKITLSLHTYLLRTAPISGLGRQTMTTAHLLWKSLRFAVAMTCLVGGLTGCRVYNLHSDQLVQPVPPPMMPPSEKARVSLPIYRIGPSDMVNIEMLKMVPLPPYRAEVYDVLQIRVTNALPDQPIDNYFIVEAEGVVNLGPTYGTVRVVGMTIEEAKKAIEQKLSFLREPEVSVQLARVAGAQSLTGQFLVAPDGTINLRQYGLVHVAGLTVTEAQIAIRKHLSHFLDSPELSVDVLAYNSQIYYVITQGAAVGDNVRRFPVTGNETVLDAITQIGGLSQQSSMHIYIARPGPANANCAQILPVDWVAITQDGATGTNYQIFPGDRIFIEQDQLVTLNNMLSKIIAPFERVFGFASLGLQTVRSGQTMGREYNHQAAQNSTNGGL
jgi:polysaccharide export outer membrane protein